MGRPRKESYEEPGREQESPAESNLPEKTLKYKVVSYVDYLLDARELLKSGPVNGTDDAWNVAHMLLFERNEVLLNGNISKGGEHRFICKA